MPKLSMLCFAIFLAGCNDIDTPMRNKVTSAPAPSAFWEAEIPSQICKMVGPDDSVQTILAAMDTDLDAIAAGKFPCGSFTEYFIPNAIQALDAGASKRQIDIRINRAVNLAKQGIFLSYYEEYLYREHGASAIKEYADVLIANASRMTM